MHLLTKKIILSELPERWSQQYNTNTPLLLGGNSDDILRKLKEEFLLTEEKAAEIIGNKSWTQNLCDECKKDSDVSVIVGDDEDYVNICKDCLNKSINLITHAPHTHINQTEQQINREI